MKWLKDEIQFSRKEFLGISGLMSIAVVVLILQFLPQTQEQLYDITIDDILLENEPQIPEKKKYKQKKTKYSKSKYEPKSQKEKKQSPTKVFEQFDFNPNKISIDSLERLGFKKRIAETWVNFRSKGKKFYEIDDVLSIYGIDSNRVFKLKDRFKFGKRKTKAKKERKVETKLIDKVFKKIDLNNCTEEDLKKLGGIGRIFASRIVKYRELLGGYARKEQLLKVYGLNDSTFQVIKEHVDVLSPPKKIKINTVSKKQLSDHLLVDYKIASLIYAYRKEHGPFVDKTDFEQVKGIPKENKNEILPYLSFAL